MILFFFFNGYFIVSTFYTLIYKLCDLPFFFFKSVCLSVSHVYLNLLIGIHFSQLFSSFFFFSLFISLYRVSQTASLARISPTVLWRNKSFAKIVRFITLCNRIWLFDNRPTLLSSIISIIDIRNFFFSKFSQLIYFRHTINFSQTFFAL